MDSTLKQRIVGIVVLIALLGFCLTVLLRNTKTTQPHIAAINTHPSMLQTALETPASSAPPVAPPNIIVTPAKPVASIPTNTDNTIATPQPKLTVATLQPASVTVLPAPSPVVTTPVKPIAPTVKITPAKSEKPAVSKIKSLPNVPPVQAKTADIIIPPPSALASATETEEAPVAAQQTVQPTQPIQSALHKRHVPASTTKKVSASALDNQKDLVVQVGTFTIAGNAQTLVDKLHSKGFSAEAQKIKTSKGEMTRVIVGKKGLNHSQVETLRSELKESLQLPGIIVSHAKG